MARSHGDAGPADMGPVDTISTHSTARPARLARTLCLLTSALAFLAEGKLDKPCASLPPNWMILRTLPTFRVVNRGRRCQAVTMAPPPPPTTPVSVAAAPPTPPPQPQAG